MQKGNDVHIMRCSDVHFKSHFNFLCIAIFVPGKVDPDPISVPFYLPITYNIACGVEGGTDWDFKDMQSRYDQVLSDVDYSDVEMNQGMYIGYNCKLIDNVHRCII